MPRSTPRTRTTHRISIRIFRWPRAVTMNHMNSIRIQPNTIIRSHKAHQPNTHIRIHRTHTTLLRLLLVIRKITLERSNIPRQFKTSIGPPNGSTRVPNRFRARQSLLILTATPSNLLRWLQTNTACRIHGPPSYIQWDRPHLLLWINLQTPNACRLSCYQHTAILGLFSVFSVCPSVFLKICFAVT